MAPMTGNGAARHPAMIRPAIRRVTPRDQGEASACGGFVGVTA